MTITETKQAMGAWDLTLKKNTPRSVLSQLGFFGHIVVTPGRINPVEYGDSLLASARYVGVLKAREGLKLSGCGMAFWLGDEDGKGDVFETPVTLTAQTFANSVTALLPPGGAVTAGTLHSIPGTYTGTHRLQTSRKAIGYVTEVFGAEWRVNGDGTLDAGTVAQLYRTTPRAVLVSKGDGEDLSYVGLPGEMSLSTDVEDYTTRVVLLGEGEGETIAVGDADAVGVTAKDIHGNTIKLTRLVSESETSATNADTRAALLLESVSTARSAVSLSSSAYDVKGDVIVGDYLYVYDPSLGFTDPANQIMWNGEVITPMALRCVEMTWPVRAGWTVAFRTVDGVWIDLSDYYHDESGSTGIVVGEFGRDTSNLGSEPVGGRPNTDTSTPATPIFVVPFQQVVYQSSAANDIRAAVLANWLQPLNVDGSTILDGSHYELRYRTTQVYNYAVTWAQLCGFSNAMLEDFAASQVNGWPAGWTVENGPTTDYQSADGVGTVYISAANSGRNTYKNVSVLNGHYVADVKNNKISTVANAYTALTFRRHATNDTYYMAQLRYRTDGFVGVRLTRRLNGSETTLLEDQLIDDIDNPGGVPHDINAWYKLEVTFQSPDSTNTIIKIRAHLADNPAPDWHVQYTDNNAAMVFSGRAGTRCFRGSGNTADSTISWDNMELTAWGSGFTWDQAQTWGRPITPPVASGEWQYAQTGWDNTQFLLQELTIAADYEIQIRAVDGANPPNMSAWSSSQFVTTTTDLIPPPAPAPPEVAASRIAVQVVHRLGQAGGGAFNMPPDLHHLEVHKGPGNSFFPDETTLIGTLQATASHIQAQIPVVGTFAIDETAEVWIKVIAVDRFGNKSSASDGANVTAELIDSAHISDLTASKITAGTIATTLLLSGSIKTASTGQRAELNSDGLQLYDANGELTVNITADDSSPNFFAVTDGPDNTLASIDQEGNVSGQIVNAAEDITIDGRSFLDDYYYPLPKGTVAYGIYTEAENGDPRYSASGAGAPGKGFMELSFFAEAGRLYRVVCNSQVISTVVSDEYAFELRDGLSSTPTTSSTRLSRAEIAGSAENFAIDLTLDYTGEFTAGLHRLLWCFFSFDGTASIYLDNHPAVMTITDIGPAIGNTAIINEGGGTAPPPVTTYTKTYNCNWYRSFTGSGSHKTDATTANQGQYTSTHGNQRSLLGFPYSTIMSDLAGATITKCEVTLYAEHWYYNAGGTAVIGTHNYTSAPGSWSDGSVNQDLLRVAKWGRGVKKTVSLGTTIGNAFKAGTAKGIALGPGPSTSLDYYGKFSTNTAGTTANRPVLKITYTK